MRKRPVLVYDGDCGFCTSAVRFAERRVRPGCEVTPWQFADLATLGVTHERAVHELLWVTPTGAVYGGAQAVAKLLLSGGRGWAVPGALLRLAPFRAPAHALYRLVAHNRHRMPGGTAACAMPAQGADTRAASGAGAAAGTGAVAGSDAASGPDAASGSDAASEPGAHEA